MLDSEKSKALTPAGPTGNMDQKRDETLAGRASVSAHGILHMTYNTIRPQEQLGGD